MVGTHGHGHGAPKVDSIIATCRCSRAFLGASVVRRRLIRHCKLHRVLVLHCGRTSCCFVGILSHGGTQGPGLACMHGYSSEYPKFLTKKIIYAVYNMYMYSKIANNSIPKRILKSYSLYSKNKSSYPL